MEGAYLPGNIRQRMQELMKEHKITQAQLATRIGSTESAISRFVSGKTDKISTEHLLRIAKVFEVSTDFLLGEVNTPDRTNFDIEELGLSVQAARNLYTGKANAEIVNRLLESPRFAEVTYMIEQYFDDTLAAGFAGQNQMLTTLSAMLRRNNKTDAAVQAVLLPPQPKPPQQKSKMIAQIQLLLPLPQSFPPKKEPPLPFPQQQHSNRIIHKIEEHPHPLSVLLHEQFVAAKSLISDLQ